MAYKEYSTGPMIPGAAHVIIAMLSHVLQKPQWLEMYNVDPTALHHTPTRLILKLGDDLRQDMITLRMFSLFEKVSVLMIHQ